MFDTDRRWRAVACLSDALCVAAGAQVVIGRAGPTERAVRARLRDLAGTRARLRRGLRLPFAAPVAGGVRVTLRRPDGTLVATGARQYPRAGNGTLRLRLAGAGRRLVARGTRPRLATRVVLAPTAAAPIAVARTHRW